MPTSSITATWRAPEAKSYQDFLVTALTKNLPARSSIEEEISKKLKKEGVKSSKSLDILGRDQKLDSAADKKAALDKIVSMSYDAIVVVTLLKKTEDTRYVAGASSYQPTNIGVGTGYFNPVTNTNTGTGTYGSFGMYYMNASSAYNTPGYYETDKVYFLETRVFDAKTKELVWSAQSDTLYPNDLATATSDFAVVVVQSMKEGRILFKKAK